MRSSFPQFDGMRSLHYVPTRSRKTGYTRGDYILCERLIHAGIAASLDDARTLRRAELTLHRWHEQECGDSNDHYSWSIETDDYGKAWRVVYPHSGKSRRCRIPNRDAGARKRVAALCERLGIHYYVQTDPRGCSLYVSKEPFRDFDYNRGVCCSVN